MPKRGSLIQDEDGMQEINISPMIDMVFILLIFFIVTTVFVEEPGVEITREFAVSAQDLDRNSILIGIPPDGTVHYGGGEIGVSGVRSIVQRQLQDNPNMPVIIQADRAAPSHVVIRVIEQVQLANGKVHLSTARR